MSGHSTLAHHFDSYDQQRESATLGTWAFLITEIMFFGALFLAYLVYRSQYPEAFAVASNHLDTWMGAFNTAILIFSSLTMALAVRAAQLGRKKGIILFLVLTILLGGVFLGVKVVEYSAKFEHHLVPGPNFEFHAAPLAEGAAAVDPRHVEIFFSIYFGMTGLHAFHMIIGIGLMLWLIWLARKDRFSPEYHNPVECVGLYWHFVDIVWIFLFPLLYLLGFHVGH